MSSLIIFKYQELINIIEKIILDKYNKNQLERQEQHREFVNETIKNIICLLYYRYEDVSLLYNHYKDNELFISWEGICKNPKALRFIENKIKQGIIKDDFFNEPAIMSALSSNVNAIDIIEKYFDKIDWNELCANPSPKALELIEKNLDKVVWHRLCANINPKAIEILESHMDKIDWEVLSANPNAIHLIEKNMDKISWTYLSMNPNALHILERPDANVSWSSFMYNDNCFDLLEKNYYHISLYEFISYHFITKPENSKKAKEFIERNIHRFVKKNQFCYVPGLIHYCGIKVDKLADYIKNATSKNIYGMDYYYKLFHNNSPEALQILTQLIDKVCKCELQGVENLCNNSYLFDLDYQAMSIARTKIIYDELLTKAMHPTRYGKALEYHLANGGGFDDFIF
jgi:hypothetical protein